MLSSSWPAAGLPLLHAAHDGSKSSARLTCEAPLCQDAMHSRNALLDHILGTVLQAARLLLESQTAIPLRSSRESCSTIASVFCAAQPCNTRGVFPLMADFSALGG
ncbi:hypothetical protein COCOBI_17-2500 [Coccomyxa sp. Obi]|nr:hypothetical protein COCOBI_17-2500 [Coccomyxa sp. Obi]